MFSSIKKQTVCSAIIAIVIAINFVPANSAFARDKCRAHVGEQVAVISAADAAQKVGKGGVTKGEFETTAEYEARKQKASGEIDGRLMTVEVTPDRSYIEYDADNARFNLSQYAWANLSGDFEAVSSMWGLSPTGTITVIDKVHGLGLHDEELPTGSYQASNAFGKAVEVVQVQRTLYSLFDKMAGEDDPTWKYDYQVRGDYSSTGGIYVPATRDVAQRLKGTMRFAIQFMPRDPYLATGSQRFEPNVDRLTDITENINVMIGSMRCLLVMDENSTVLKTVPVAY